MPPRSTMSFDLSALGERLQSTERGLEEFKASTSTALSEITRQIQHLATHMDSRLRPQWGVLLSAFGAVMYVLIYFVIQPMQHDLERTNIQVAEMAKETIKALHDLRISSVSSQSFEAHATAQVRYEERIETRLHQLEMHTVTPQAH